MLIDCERSVEIVRSPRVLQLEGLFDVPPSQRSARRWRVELPLEGWDWHVGLVTGPSGSGKSTVAREAFGPRLVTGFDWPADRAVVDAFPEGVSVKEVAGLLSSVGFSSPPAWLRPFRCLSNGEQFRATIARALAEPAELVAVDEFTSVVDRTSARVGSAAVAKCVRRTGRRFVAVTCHDDVADWLDPDWVLEMPQGTFTRRCLRGRPPVALEVVRCRPAAWELFKHHHYLDAGLHRCARCFLALVEGRPAAFTAALHFPHPKRSGWREHRTVCLPDFQGVGIGNALSEFVAALFAATGKPYRSTTSHPAMTAHRLRSPLWRLIRPPSLAHGRFHRSTLPAFKRTAAVRRLTVSFEYTGPARPAEARALGVL